MVVSSASGRIRRLFLLASNIRPRTHRNKRICLLPIESSAFLMLLYRPTGITRRVRHATLTTGDDRGSGEAAVWRAHYQGARRARLAVRARSEHGQMVSPHPESHSRHEALR